MSRIQDVRVVEWCPNVGLTVSNPNAEVLLQGILDALTGGITVDPSEAWGAIFLEALNSSEITLSAETIAALNPMTVVIDGQTGPIEVTGTVTLDNDDLSVTITELPPVVISNWDELLAATLSVTLNGETVNVSLSPEQIEALADKDDTDDDLRPVSIHCFNWAADGTTGSFIGWANAAEDGSFAGYTVVSGTAPPEGAEVMCETMAVTSIVAVSNEPRCANVNGVAGYVMPVTMLDTGTGEATNIVYLNEDGKPVQEVTFDADPCDCLTPCPDCNNELVQCADNSLFFTTATAEYTINSVCDGAGNDISSQFTGITFPVNGNDTTELGAFDEALNAWLAANGATNIDRVQGRDGFRYTWSGPSLTVKQSSNDLESCQEGAEVRACTQMLAFDYDRGLLEAGETTAYRITDNGTVVATVVHDYTTSYDGNNVSTYYDPVMAAINALPSWSITLVTDVAGTDQGKPNWRVDYAGAGAGELIIDKASSVASLGNGDSYIIRVDNAGVMTTAVREGGGGEIPDFNSPAFSSCA